VIQINTAVMRTSGKWRETQQVNRRVSQRRLQCTLRILRIL